MAQLIKRAQNRHHRMLDAELTRRGLSLVQWDALRHLDRHPDASLHDLAVLTFQSDQAFGTLSTRMVDRGLVERHPGPGRAVRLRMTPRGRTLLAEGRGAVDAVLAETFSTLSASQVDTLGDLLTLLMESDPA